MSKFITIPISIAILLLLLLILPVSAAALGETEVTVSIPGFQTTINERVFDNTQAQYPLIVYDDITYFPLTWHWCQELGLAVSWTEDKGLYIANYVPDSSQVEDTGCVNDKNIIYTAVIPSYPIVLNTHEIDNAKEEYPLLNFRGVTYFPMTWRFVHDEFGWQISWDDTKGLTVNSMNSEPIMYLVEAFDDHALLQTSETYYTEIKNEDGTTSFHFNGQRYTSYHLDYAANSLITIDSDASSIHNDAKNYTDISEDITVEGTYLMYKGTVLDDLSELAAEKTEADEQSDKYFLVYAHQYPYGSSSVIFATVYYHTYIPAPYTPDVYKLFIEKNGTVRKLESWPESQPLSSVYPDGAGGYYLCSNYQDLGGRWSNNLGSIYHVDENGDILCLNDLYEDHNSLQAIGMANGVLYIKATWFPNVNEVFTQGDVSAVNDGFFTLDSDGKLTKIRSFVSGEAFLTPSGGLYCCLSWKTGLMDLRTGELILP